MNSISRKFVNRLKNSTKEFKYLVPRCRASASSDLQNRQAELMAKKLPVKKPIPGVKHIVLVASGKGGVGKTTTAVNIACAMKQIDPQKNIGLLDADVFGPSVPTMMKLSGEPILNKDNLMEPLQNYGVKCMSMGFLVPGEGAVIWRGLMVMQALARLTRQVAWGPLDCLVVDTPPGTGDTHLSLAQNLPIDGAVLVTTPQAVALQVTRRGATMLSKLNVPIIGLVENMSHSVCEKCHTVNRVFGEGTDKLATDLNIDILDSLEIDKVLSTSGDIGRPTVISAPDSQHAIKYKNVAMAVYKFLENKEIKEK